MIVVDTNVLSALMRRVPDASVITWLDRQPRTSVWTTSITILEVQFGLHVMPAGKRRSGLMELFERVLTEKIERRVASFDTLAARHTAELMAVRQKNGRPGELRDTMIAGIVLASRATLATRNTRHFDDLSVPMVNPWEA
ncbi:MAG: toxin FitB [Acidobacteriaceae bacterium]|nr:toxin FitB [Acidobacteriaceae bacterium]